MPKLSILTVLFPPEKIGDDEVIHLVSYLQACRSLQALNLDFQDAGQLTDDSIRCFSRGLRGLWSLKDLQLTFGRKEEFSNEAVFGFYESLTALKSWKE